MDLWLSASSSALRDGLEVLGVGVLVGLLDGPEWHAGIGYLSGSITLLTRSRDTSWPQDATADTQASRQAKHCAYRGILIEKRVLGSLSV